MGLLIKKFSPSSMSDEEVLAQATGREKLLATILEEMKACINRGSNQHFVLYGPRGIGKSFFLRLLKIHHDQSEVFSKGLFVQLPEEQDNVNFAADLLDIISVVLEGGRLADAKPSWSISPLQWHASVKRLRTIIDKIRNDRGIQHVFVTQENLLAFIPRLDKIESARLREFLSDFDEITLIGSSLRPDLDNDYSKRLFHVFKKLDMEPWDSDDFINYYEKLSILSKKGESHMENMKGAKNKIRAISRFTGGNPRLAAILSSLILDKDVLKTAQLLEGIIDDLTPYYQDITNDIPHKSRILFDMLIRKGENMTQSALAACFDPPLGQSSIARSFSWLLDNYYVTYSKQSRGNTKYFYVRDRLYVLYYQKRQIYADVSHSFIGAFVDFLYDFYMQEESEIRKFHAGQPEITPKIHGLENEKSPVVRSASGHNVIQEENTVYYSSSNEKKNDKTAETENDLTIQAKDHFEQGNKYAGRGEYDKAIEAYDKAIELKPDQRLFLENALALIIVNGYWKCLEQFNHLWKGTVSLSTVLGSSLSGVIKKNVSDRFYYFKNTIDNVKDLSFINRYEVINALCLGLYIDEDLPFLDQIIDELKRESENDQIMALIIQVFSYLSDPYSHDISRLHPDARAVVDAVLYNK